MKAIYPDDIAPELSFQLLSGETFNISNRNPKYYTIVIFYRGAHCPLCMNHIKEIEEHYQSALDAGLEIVLVSMDSKEKAETSTKDIAKTVPIGYGITEATARTWGLYISGGRPNTSEPAVFSEPGLFVIRPDKTIFMILTQSAPFTRPSIPQLIWGLQYAIENKYPTRGNLKKIE
jgi:peroxiredoxin